MASEILTLAQTGNFGRPVPVVLYGSDYWTETMNFKALLRHGMIGAEDLSLSECVDTPDAAALRML